ncbi:hypothetical protein F2P79_010669 [Pimephales promelas]|nr:hypothetical protein F2P79_010669 [Pimephales promelas]
MKLGCDSDLPVWQVALVVLSVGGEDLRRRSAVVSRTVELPVCAVLWDQMLAAWAVCAMRSQEAAKLVHLSSTDCELAQLCGRVESVQLSMYQTA